ncbi:MAG: hypothetical protein CK425_01880 [Parachlamydia sp.]|nr:MAG: hypothetical protein CK425_01880 [Parachlamydia sp.]
MKKQSVKTINQTFSLPLEISQELHTYVKRREMSRFVSDAIRKELEAKKEELRQAYLMANEDEGQAEATDDWQGTLADGADEW